MQFDNPLSELDVCVDRLSDGDLAQIDAARLAVLVRRLENVLCRATANLSDNAAAQISGTSIRVVRRDRTIHAKAQLIPGLADAIAAGAASVEQARVVIDNPEVASDLLRFADNHSVTEMRSEAVRLQRLGGQTDAERQRRVESRRDVSKWVDAEGVYGLLARLTPDEGAQVDARLDAQERLMVKAPGTSAQAHRANAFFALITGAGVQSNSTTAPSIAVHISVDLDSLNRGAVGADGHCEIAGIGPVPVSRVRSCFDTAVLHVLGTRRNALQFAGSTKELPLSIKDAVAAFCRFKCSTCGEPGFHVDHIEALVNQGTDDLSNLQLLCQACHAEKTVDDAPWTRDKYRRYRRPPPDEHIRC